MMQPPSLLWVVAATAAVALGDIKCNYFVDNDTCVINTTATGTLLAWNGSVLITGGAALSSGMAGDLVIRANGSLEIEKNSTVLAANGRVKLSGARLSIRSAARVAAKVAVEIEAAAGGVEISSKGQDDDLQPTLSTALISVVANGSGSATIAAVITDYHDPTSLPELRLRAAGTLTLGPPKRDTIWNLKTLRATADTIVLLNHSIRTNGDSCGNSAMPMPPADVCAQSLGGELRAGSVAFDFELVAATSLSVEYTAVHAASMLLCSGGQAELKDQTKLDANGRGCTANHGPGAGAHGDGKCGGGGGSHLGAGGSAAQLVASQMRMCAAGGLPYDGPAGGPAGGPGAWWSRLPTQGASGGGCAGDPCEADHSSGGGLVWVSAQELSVSTSAQLLANGEHGDSGSKGKGAEVAWGGGAGGQVLVYTSSLRAIEAAPSPDADEPQLVRLSASGGDTACSKNTFSGGGGGGVVAFGSYNSSAPWINDATKFDVSVGGGSMSAYCQQYVPKSYWRTLAGKPGEALPLASCKPGFATMFCTPCPVGKYSPGGLVGDCLECTNKQGFSNYTDSTWPNSSCSYVCNPGVPFVAVNGACLGAAGFFFHFFGGTWGLLSMCLSLAVLSGLLLWRSRRAKRRQDAQERARPSPSETVSPAASFVQATRTTNSPPTLAARLSAWLRSCRSRLQLCVGAQVRDEGGLHFTTEHLPFHTSRIYFAGSNRSGDPWAVPRELPDQLACEVSEQGWQRLALEAGALAAVPRPESLAHVASICSTPRCRCCMAAGAGGTARRGSRAWHAGCPRGRTSGGPCARRSKRRGSW
ncbi:unnamed protein product [Prorocentrum cordatum]|uniref:Tyrosine-protein kinase ephrin type A/B receptor-like domain-containing protein n=1 Tax=Prorocentrum cordatum TaxID=2364126 RepID=A0ABN9T6E9_9DINO|nr:unnamed protein product [Polarella glacialis]